MRILLYGIGNPGRQDDGLGPAVVEAVEQSLATAAADREDEARGEGAAQEISFDANYQLNVEDAEAVSRQDVEVFVDASLGGSSAGETAAGSVATTGSPPFELTRVAAEAGASFSTHSVSAGAVLALCHELYGSHPAVFMLAVRGASWEVNEPLSAGARENLGAAVAFLLQALASGDRAQGPRDFLDGIVSSPK